MKDVQKGRLFKISYCDINPFVQIYRPKGYWYKAIPLIISYMVLFKTNYYLNDGIISYKYDPESNTILFLNYRDQQT